MIDFHSHILPGFDDGASNTTEAVEMARILAEAGFTGVWCTPHQIRGSYEASSRTLMETTAALQKRLDGLGIELRLFAGREYYLDEFLMDFLGDHAQLTDPAFLLVEIPDNAAPAFVQDTFYRIRLSGYTPVIAHPERCALFSVTEQKKAGRFSLLRAVSILSDPEPGAQNTKSDGVSPSAHHSSQRYETAVLVYLKEIGCLFQGNIGSFAGAYGERVRRRAVRFLQEGLYNCLGSDAHGPQNLAAWLDSGLREVERHVGVAALRELLEGTLMNAGGRERLEIGGWG